MSKHTPTSQSSQEKVRLFYRFLEWRRRNVSEKAFIFILATIVGLLSGTAAFVLKTMINGLSSFLTGHFGEIGVKPALIILPFLGIVFTAFFCRKIVKIHLAHGTEQLIRDLKVKMYRLKRKVAYMPVLASTITLGFGGSAGAEGPIAYTGAGIGSQVGQFFRLTPHNMMILMGCGAGAGIAGIFKSPLGGAFFTFEVLRMSMTTFSAIVLITTTITSALTAYALSGFTLDIPFHPAIEFEPKLLPFVILLGVFCGFYSLYYSFIMKTLRLLLDRFRKKWMMNCCAGAILGLLVFCFPVLYGEGYGVVGDLINGDSSHLLNDSLFSGLGHGPWLLIIFAGGTILAKCFATSSTNNGGGVSGDFAPTLFAGCMVGFFFSMLLNTLFHLHLPVGHFAYFAMAGVMAGAIRAPLMAIFLVCEMAGAFTFFLPLVITAATSFGIVRLFTADDFFTHRTDRTNGVLTRLNRPEQKI